jgi:outer membrane biosynthesis protein TonB
MLLPSPLFRFLFLLAPLPSLHAQDRVYLPFDLSKTASLPGGPSEATKYFRKHIPYPKQPGQPSSNRLVVAFVIEKDGSVQKPHIHVFETPGEVFTEAVLSCLQSSKWMPAEANGNPVRYFMTLMFLFHHASATVSWGETGIDLNSYEQLLSIPPEDYSKIEFYNAPKFMGIDPRDSVANIQRYPEAARLANIQGVVSVDLLIKKNGQVGDITLKHDLGYGCGEEALRRARLYRNWVPAQVFDSVFEAHTQLHFAFCPHPERVDTSGTYAEEELWSAQVNNLFNYGEGKYNRKYEPGKNAPPVSYDRSFVELEFTITKAGLNDSIVILSSPGDGYTQIARDILQREKRYQGLECCNIPVNARLHRYASFIDVRDIRDRYFHYVVFTKENPATTPHLLPPDDSNIYEQSQVDQPAFYHVPGEKGIEYALTLEWPERKKEIPPGDSILVRILLEKDGSVREAKIVHGIDEQLDEKARHFVLIMGFWKPARKNGHPVRSWKVVRIW